MTWRKAKGALAGAFVAWEAVACVGTRPAAGADGAPSDMPSSASFHVDDASLPDPARTPGDWFRNAKSGSLCKDGSAGRSSIPSAALCDGAFADYGISSAYRFQYVCRFLVPVGIGGASTPRNVWPQPAAEAVAKDALDREVQRQVCDEGAPPRAAQSEIAADWVKAYRHYLLPGDPAPITVKTQTSGGATPIDVEPSVTPRASFQNEVDGPSPGRDRRRTPAAEAAVGTAIGATDAGPSLPAGSRRPDAAATQQGTTLGGRRADNAAPVRRQTPAGVPHARAASVGAARQR